MAAPAFVKAGAGVAIASGSSACTLAGTTAGNTIILQVLQDGTAASAVTLSSITNLENLADTASALTTLAAAQPVGSPTAALQHLYIGRSLGGTVSVTVATTGDDIFYRLYEFSGVNTGTTLAAVTEGIANGVGLSNIVSDTGVTTAGADRLVCQFVGINDDNAPGPFTGMTGGRWFKALPEFSSATGTDACIQLQLGFSPELDYLAAGAEGSFLGNTAARIRLAQPFTAPRTETLGTVILVVSAAGAPVDTVTVRIETDAGGAPSGTLVGTQVALSPVPSVSFSNYVVPVQAPVTAATKYWIVLARTGAVDAASYFTWNEASTGYAGHETYIYNGTTWALNVEGTTLTRRFALGSPIASSGTINGGTNNMIDSDSWGVIGLALLPVPSVAGTAWEQAVDDTLSLADSATTQSGKTASIGDTLALTDATAFEAAFARTITDTVALADTLSSQAAFLRGLADTLTLADLADPVKGVGGVDHAQPVADTLALTDSVAMQRGIAQAIADTLSVADAVASQAAFVRAVADSLTLADALSSAGVFQRAIADTLALSDSAASVAAFLRTVADTLTLADSASPVEGEGGVAHSQPIADTLALADSLSSQAAYLRAVADTLSVLDTVVTAEAGIQQIADTLALADALRFDRTLSLADALTLADAITAGSQLTRAVADTLALADSVTAQKAILRALADTVSLAEALRFARAFGLTDTVALADTVAFQAVYLRTLADTVSLTDAVTAGLQLTRAFADTVALLDSLAATLGRAVTLEDTVALTDLLDALLTAAVGAPPRASGRIDFPGVGVITRPTPGVRAGNGRGRLDTSTVGVLTKPRRGTT